MKTHKNSVKSLLLSLITALVFLSCETITQKKDDTPSDFRKEMRDFVIGISKYAKQKHPGFLVIPQNGIELILNNPSVGDSIHTDYLNAIDGMGQEDFLFGYNNDDVQTPKAETEYLTEILNMANQRGKKILITDYCSSPSFMDYSYNYSYDLGYISFAADHRGLDNIPAYPQWVYRDNSYVIDTLTKAQNFLYIIDLANYNSTEEFIEDVTETNFDLLITDLFLNDSISFDSEDIKNLRGKKNNGKRLIVCYLSIGEAEDYRYYWQSSWSSAKPAWLKEENPDWEGNFKVNYWNPEWKDIIYGNQDAYLDKILDAGFDGVYLDLIDAYEYFEN